MVKINYSIILFLLALPIQKTDPVHLSFNIQPGDIAINKVTTETKITFTIGEERFDCTKLESIQKLDEAVVQNVKLLDLPGFLKFAEKNRKEAIKMEEDKGTITILGNDEVFKKIYLYEKVGGGVHRYEVTWADVIVD